ncbi:50S ribosomal protein L7/L12 [Candidatus Similichlamydia laticola]|uniref:Large ribosomal subunit protein bL12 n=1 Tax=Candidatus Similichlamydia laticola TaxID=2170265 RepID=A0A369KIW0_9BACT|nr:50S ribosomal protein L7/L12 [Candidatus Similichlamydia laticola]RDB31704.1 LSU ribosomal protein L7/L12 (P1/P2) [Candidatus Similichlamydia laticola]
MNNKELKKQLVEQLSGLTVLEMSDLVKELEQTWGVSAAAPVASVVAGISSGGAAEGEVAAQAATEFDVVLKGATDPSAQIPLIKELKSLCGLSLRDSKEAVEEVCAGKPRMIKGKVEKAEAEELAKKLKAAGAIVEVSASTD